MPEKKFPNCKNCLNTVVTKKKKTKKTKKLKKLEMNSIFWALFSSCHSRPLVPIPFDAPLVGTEKLGNQPYMGEARSCSESPQACVPEVLWESFQEASPAAASA